MKHIRKRNTAKRRDLLLTIILICMLFAGVVILLYPTVSNWWNERVMSRAVAVYDQTVSELTDDEYAACFEEAEAYNEALREIGSVTALSAPDLTEGYEETLDITGTGIMGYITIEKIGVQLPIYHGTESSVLAAGAGHLKGSSLPVGGEGTHSVISAHRGLPSAELFTNLDQLEVGDTFYITVLDRVFTYEVDLITIVLPNEMQNLYMEEGEDYCTLMTCTPYGINTHRLLVRGHRADNVETTHIYVTADAAEIGVFQVAIFLALPMLAVLLIWLIVSTHKKKEKGSQRHKSEQDKIGEASL